MIVLLASALQAVTGFGFALIATPLLLMILPPPVAVATTMCVSLSCLVILSMRSRKHADTGTVRWLAVGSVFGIPLGAYVLTHANPQSIKLLASIVTLGIALYFMARMDSKRIFVRAPAPWVCLIVGSISGFLTTSVSMPGPPVVLALSSAGMPKQMFRATGSAFFAVVYSVSAFTLIISGVIDLAVIMLVASLVPVAILGNRLGDWLFDRIPQALFDKVVPALLMITAINNVIRR